MKKVRYSLACRWFCRLSLDDDVPDHSSLSRIHDRYGENIFENVFREIVALCRKKGLIQEECRVITDATLIGADASLNSLVHNDPEQAQQESEAQQHRGMTDSRPKRKLSNETHRSRIDPDTTLAQKKGSLRHFGRKAV